MAIDVQVNEEEGYVIITNKGTSELTLSRSESGYGYIDLANLKKNATFKDRTVESGKPYQYKLGVEEKTVTPYFEYIFLSDGNKSIKIKYNSKVTGFRETILEQKIETIGNKYPFIFRNNDIQYKEIQITGLISHVMDDENMFGLNISTKDMELSNKNFYKERKFREKCYEWLTNGRPKLFRSAQEGNCVIQLTNVSLTPMDQLGRLIYSFSATGYEIMDCDISTLKANNLVGGN